MRCPSCDAENPALASFCYACGSRLTSLAKSKSGAGAQASGGADAKLGLVETAPFESSPLQGAAPTPSAAPAPGRLHDSSPSALTDTIIDMSPEAMAAIRSAAAAPANDAATTQVDGGGGPEANAGKTPHDPGAEGWAGPSTGLNVGVDDTHREGPVGMGGDDAGPSFDDEAPARVRTKAKTPRELRGPETSWSSGEAGALGAGAGSGAGSAASRSFDDDDFELRRAKRVTFVQRLLVVFIVACLAGAAYFVISGVRSMRSTGGDVRAAPPKVGDVRSPGRLSRAQRANQMTASASVQPGARA